MRVYFDTGVFIDPATDGSGNQQNASAFRYSFDSYDPFANIPGQMMVGLVKISVLDLTAATMRLQLRQLELQTRGILAADALHTASAIEFDADLLGFNG